MLVKVKPNHSGGVLVSSVVIMGSSPSRVEPKTIIIKLVFANSLLGT